MLDLLNSPVGKLVNFAIWKAFFEDERESRKYKAYYVSEVRICKAMKKLGVLLERFNNY